MAGNAKWDAVRDGILAALKAVGKKHKVVFENGGYTWDVDTCTFRVRATVTNASGVKKDLAREEFLREVRRTGAIIKKSWLDKPFTERGRSYKIIGYKPFVRFCVNTVRDDGKTYSWTEEFVAEKMKVKKAA